MEHARLYPDKTLGVGAFSVAQRDAILNELELRRRQAVELETFFATAAAEPFFVKNLENIQGDERDVILISIGYAKDSSGYMAMSFGPLNNEGGERRLNVLITRARERCEVFSSITADDIDLIVLYDQDAIDYLGPQTPQDCFVRLTQELVRILQERTAEGYVFRTDLRLRPEGGATPLALPMIAAENYYESQGQNWERAAMIKARPVAGDLVAGRDFLARIAPFIWRKYLDFAAIQDIHSIKRQIHDHRGHARIAVAGHNIKLGRGGIREIEFFV
ncbi:MAG: hypothetical protein IH899_02620, partial [Planctomycetes bacterium]|nr:hypothetical protein [Planctomycetota bacterium]